MLLIVSIIKFKKHSIIRTEYITLKALVTTAADDTHKYYFIVFHMVMRLSMRTPEIINYPLPKAEGYWFLLACLPLCLSRAISK